MMLAVALHIAHNGRILDEALLEKKSISFQVVECVYYYS
jgi:hypothetical protein